MKKDQIFTRRMNLHVKNTVYVTRAMETLPISWLFKYIPHSLVAFYLKKSFYPDKIIVRTKLCDKNRFMKTCHAFFHEASSAKLVCLTLTWKKISHGPV